MDKQTLQVLGWGALALLALWVVGAVPVLISFAVIGCAVWLIGYVGYHAWIAYKEETEKQTKQDSV